MQGDVILVAGGEPRRAGRIDKGGEAEPCAELDQDVLERPHVAVGRDDRLADRIGRSLDAADRPVEQGNAIRRRSAEPEMWPTHSERREAGRTTGNPGRNRP